MGEFLPFYINSFLTGGMNYRVKKKEREKRMQEATFLEKRRPNIFIYNFIMLKKLIDINNLITQEVNLS